MKRIVRGLFALLCGLALGVLSLPRAAGALTLPEAADTHIYANGTALLICAEGAGATVYLDADADGSLDAGERSLWEAGVAGAPRDGADLSRCTVYGGGWERACAGDTTLTMLGGTVAALYGGGCGRNARVGGDTRVTLRGGVVTGGVYGGGNGSAADVAGSAQITMLGGTVEGSIYGGGRGGDYLLSDYADVSGRAQISIAGGYAAGNVYGGACLYGRVKGGAVLTLTGGTVAGNVVAGAAYPSTHTKVLGRRVLVLSGAPTIGRAGAEAADGITGVVLAGFTGRCARIGGSFDYPDGSFASVVLLAESRLSPGTAVAAAQSGARPDPNPFVLYAGGACLPLAASDGRVVVLQ